MEPYGRVQIVFMVSFWSVSDVRSHETVWLTGTTEDFWFIVTIRRIGMKQTSENNGTFEQVMKDIRRETRKQFSDEEKIRIVLDGLRGE